MSVKEKPKSGTTVEYCGCPNTYQDSKYGQYKRVHNVMANGWRRCTVCRSEKT